MLQGNDFTRKDKLIIELLSILSETDNLPLIEVLRHVCFILLIDLIWIDSSLGRGRSEFTLFVLSLDLVSYVFFADMKIRVVFRVVQQDMVIVNYIGSVFTVLVSGMDLVGYPLSWWFGDEFNLLASSIGLGYLFSKLEVISGIGVL